MEKIIILMAANDAYSMPMTIAAHSCLRHLRLGHQVELHLLNDGISSRNVKKAEICLKAAYPLVDIKWRQESLGDFEKINVGRYSLASMARLMVPNLFSKDVEKVLYIDSDTVVTDDISQLWKISLRNIPVWAVGNGPKDNFKTSIADKFPEYAQDRIVPYFNSGVLLINLPQWRAQNVSEKAIDFLERNSESLSFPDQDALNAVIGGAWGKLETRWNKQVPLINHETGAKAHELGIIHYTSHKPWNRDFTWPCKIDFLRAYLHSGWDPVPKSWLWAATRYFEQTIRHNYIRILRRLK